jgi:membrane-associated protein
MCAIASILGGIIGYWSGATIGRKLFERESFIIFNKNRIYDFERFYNKHGPITILFARFIPFVRTFSPIVAGVGRMNYKSFTIYNIVGALLWTSVAPLLGYYFGGFIPNPDRFLLPVAMIIIGISFLPFIVKLVHHYLIKSRR